MRRVLRRALPLRPQLLGCTPLTPFAVVKPPSGFEHGNIALRFVVGSRRRLVFLAPALRPGHQRTPEVRSARQWALR